VSVSHLIYVPAVLLLGIVIGYALRGRVAEAARADREHSASGRATRRTGASPPDSP
jgi:hypothetical protein